MKQNLPTTAKHQSSFQKPVERVPLNELARKKAQNEVNVPKEIQTTNVLARRFILYYYFTSFSVFYLRFYLLIRIFE